MPDRSGAGTVLVRWNLVDKSGQTGSMICPGTARYTQSGASWGEIGLLLSSTISAIGLCRLPVRHGIFCTVTTEQQEMAEAGPMDVTAAGWLRLIDGDLKVAMLLSISMASFVFVAVLDGSMDGVLVAEGRADG